MHFVLERTFILTGSCWAGAEYWIDLGNLRKHFSELTVYSKFHS